MKRKETYISVDVESSGSIPNPYSMLSLGACDVNHIENTFYCELKPLNSLYEQKALAVAVKGIHILETMKGNPEYDPSSPSFKPHKVMSLLSREGQKPRQAMYEFVEWINDTAKGTKPVFVAFNATYDWSFVNWYLRFFTGENPFGVSGADIKAYYAGAFNKSWSETTKNRLPKSLLPKKPHTHNALEDAIEQAELFANMYRALPLENMRRYLKYNHDTQALKHLDEYLKTFGDTPADTHTKTHH